MKRATIVLGATLTGFALSASPAFAEAVSGCTTTFTTALEGDVLTNGPVHTSGTGITIGSFTPGTFSAGAEGPTAAYVRCM